MLTRMAQRPGPKPTPRNLRIVRGTDVPAPKPGEPKDAVEPPVGIPDAPEDLTPEEQGVFLETARRLARMRVMTDADVDALHMYAVEFCRYRDATAKVRSMGMIVKSPNDYPIQNPYLAIANKAQRTCINLLTEFGLTPSSRTRIKQS